MFPNSDSPLIISDDQDIGFDEMNIWCPSIPRNFTVEPRIIHSMQTAHLLEELEMNDDLKRLNPGEFLNDTLIELGLKLWLGDLEISNPDLADQVHVFSSFFYKKLSEKGFRGGYEGVRQWTRKIDIFRKTYIIVPINENLHWYLAVIYKPEHVLKVPPVEVDPELLENTCIFILDSLGNPHDQTIEELSSYLTMEAKCKKFVDTTGKIVGKTAQVSFQTNLVDCGIYLIHFVRTFMNNPKKYASIILFSPKSIRLTERKAIWLIDKDFERNGREQLRLPIETLYNDLKTIRDSVQDESEVQVRDDESEGEVEFV